MNEPKYRRVLLKISGEALAGDAHRGLNFDVIGSVCDVVKQCVEAGVQVGIVVGGGNFWRGIKDGGDRMERTRADQMGMLALYNLIGINQKEDQPMCIGTVKTMLDKAMERAQSGLFKRSKKRVDRDGYTVLFEKDFS